MHEDLVVEFDFVIGDSREPLRRSAHNGSPAYSFYDSAGLNSRDVQL